jgi:hypothetical protein
VGQHSLKVVTGTLTHTVPPPECSGDVLLSQLQTVKTIVGDSLWNIMSQPDNMTWRLARHFKSPLALQQHVQAVVTALKHLKRLAPPSCMDAWMEVLEQARSKCNQMKRTIEALYKGAA